MSRGGATGDVVQPVPKIRGTNQPRRGTEHCRCGSSPKERGAGTTQVSGRSTNCKDERQLLPWSERTSDPPLGSGYQAEIVDVDRGGAGIDDGEQEPERHVSGN